LRGGERRKSNGLLCNCDDDVVWAGLKYDLGKRRVGGGDGGGGPWQGKMKTSKHTERAGWLSVVDGGVYGVWRKGG